MRRPFAERAGLVARCGWRIWLAAVLVMVLASPVIAAQEADLQQLRRGVLALQQVLSRVERELAARHAAVDDREERLFLVFLRSRISEECHRLLAAGGRLAVAGLDCPAGGASLPGQAEPVARSSAEEVELLDRQLARDLGAFDEMLLAEEKRLAARVPRQRASAGGRSGNGRSGEGRAGAAGAGTAGGGTTDAAGGHGSDQGQGRDGTTGTPGAVGHAASGREQGGGKGRTGAGVAGRDADGGRPADTGAMAADDDIVARQLREAAEKEADPELKKRLWQEYRKYRAGR